MPFFSPRKKVAEYETERSLPGFHLDMNGFLIFDDPRLGGCGVFEVIPLAMTPGLTHAETANPNVKTDVPGYHSKNGVSFEDRRPDIFRQWIDFINGLQPVDEADDATHVQILIKTTRPSAWSTNYTYNIEQTKRDVQDFFDRNKNVNKRLLNVRTNDYLSMLMSQNNELIHTKNNAYGSYSYDIKMYLVVSYTPSSEGWWLDGRDNDYYVFDSDSDKGLFSTDRLMDIVDGIMSKRKRKQEERDDFNTANMLFSVDDDKVSQVIHTRMSKIERNFIRYSSKKDEGHLGFTIRRLHSVELTSLIAFFNDPLNPYADKVWGMKSSYDDILYNMRNEIAITTDDAGAFDSGIDESDERSFFQGFVGNESALHGADNVSYSDGENDDAHASDEATMGISDEWHDIDSGYSIGSIEEGQSDEERFLSRFKNRTLAADKVRQFQSDIAGYDGLEDSYDDDVGLSPVAHQETEQKRVDKNRKRELKRKEKGLSQLLDEDIVDEEYYLQRVKDEQMGNRKRLVRIDGKAANISSGFADSGNDKTS